MTPEIEGRPTPRVAQCYPDAGGWRVDAWGFWYGVLRLVSLTGMPLKTLKDDGRHGDAGPDDTIYSCWIDLDPAGFTVKDDLGNEARVTPLDITETC